MIILYFLIFQIYNPSKLDPFKIFKKMENPSESLFMILPEKRKEVEITGGSLNRFKFDFFEKKYFIKSNNYLIFPEKRRYTCSENIFTFYPFFPETLLTFKGNIWNYDRERAQIFAPFKLNFMRKQKYFKVFIKDTGVLFTGQENYFMNYVQTEAGLGFIGAGFIHEFLYAKTRDFFVSPYVFGIFEFKNLFYIYPEIYFDVVENQFYPGFSFSYTPYKYHILTFSYEKRNFLSLIPEVYDTFLPFFPFRDSLRNLMSFKNELIFLYQGRWFEKIYMKLKYTWGVYDTITFFDKDSIWRQVIFEHIKTNRFEGIIKYQFSKFKFYLNYLYLYSDDFKDYWKNRIGLNIGYDFKIVKPCFGFLYSFKFKEPVYKFDVYIFLHKKIYLKGFLTWLKNPVKYYNNYTLNREVGIGIGIKKD